MKDVVKEFENSLGCIVGRILDFSFGDVYEKKKKERKNKKKRKETCSNDTNGQKYD